MNQEKIGKYIAKKRNEQNLTQQQLADRLNISKNAVSKWERGLCLMDMSLLIPLSKILNTSVINILNGEDTQQNQKYNETIESILKQTEKNSRSFAMYGLVISYIILFIFKEIKGINNYDIMSILLMYIGFKLLYKINKKTKYNKIIYITLGILSVLASIILTILYIKSYI